MCQMLERYAYFANLCSATRAGLLALLQPACRGCSVWHPASLWRECAPHTDGKAGTQVSGQAHCAVAAQAACSSGRSGASRQISDGVL